MATANQMYGRLRSYAEHRADVPRPLTLLHSMAWLNEDYSPEASGHESSAVLTFGPGGQDFSATDWLAGRKRGLLASWSVGTIDQVLMTVLKVKHNVVRLLGLTGKVVVVDEAHAVDPYMQEELERLLQWLGKLNVPVILLSATLHRAVAEAYTAAYLTGAGKHHSTTPGRRRRRSMAARPSLVERIEYPGWLYADAVTGAVSRNPEPVTATEREPLRLDLVSVPVEGKKREREADRSAALESELSGLLSSNKGYAAVICTTVAEAQEVYDLIGGMVQERFQGADSPPELMLLHARFPGWQRDETTRRVIELFGKDRSGSNRPESAILVATQIIEQSLDLDFDLIITDLAPISLLLQRAGRCWRHQNLGAITRPEWSLYPRVAVLAPEHPIGSEMPDMWSYVYPVSLLVRTQNLLLERVEGSIAVPGDVQGLVERVYDDPALIDDMKSDIERVGKDMGMRTQARNVLVPGPDSLNGGLYELTTGSSGIDEAMVTTRFDADSVRVLCCYRDTRGGKWLDRECTVPLPERGSGRKGAFTDEEVAQVIRRTIPVRGGPWVPARADCEAARPPAWRKEFRLRELVMMPQSVAADGVPQPGGLGGRTWWLDKQKGLMWW